MNIRSTIFGLVFLTGIVLLIYSTKQHPSQDLIPPNQVLEMEQSFEKNQHFVAKDFKSLYKEKHLPKAFFDLHDVRVTYQEENLKEIIPLQAIPFKTYSTGKHNLEIEVFSAPTQDNKIVVLQLNLIHRKSGNKVFELSRNYEIPN